MTIERKGGAGDRSPTDVSGMKGRTLIIERTNIVSRTIGLHDCRPATAGADQLARLASSRRQG